MIRVFPRRTSASPTDGMAFFGPPPATIPAAGSVSVSVTFTYDRRAGEALAKAWEATGLPVHIGGVAYGDPGGEFVPGRFLKPGYVITSRGCPNSCWFCDVHSREGSVRELPITDGWNVLDSNLLACSSGHIDAVFAMLSRQSHRPRFTGGIDPARVTPEIARKIAALRPDGLFCAYDTPNDLEPLREAGRHFHSAGLKRKHPLQAYVLVGYRGDTFDKAEERLRETWDAGFLPMAMLYRDQSFEDWRRFQRSWARPHAIAATMARGKGEGK